MKPHFDHKIKMADNISLCVGTDHCVSDQGGEFVNELNEQLFTMTGTNHRVGSAYHPQTNGMVERLN